MGWYPECVLARVARECRSRFPVDPDLRRGGGGAARWVVEPVTGAPRPKCRLSMGFRLRAGSPTFGLKSYIGPD